MTRSLIYLADLRHNYAGVLTSDCMPLGISYLKAVMDREIPEVESLLFAYPAVLLEAIKARPPDVLMLSNYLWNEELSFLFARALKRIRPESLVVMGGPNIPLEEARRIDFVSSHPELDLYALGEGDFTGSEVVKCYLDSSRSLHRMMQKEIPSAIYRIPDGPVVLHPPLPMSRDLDRIPSPWLTGIQDIFFDGKLAPMIETNRGCPFTCLFCVQGAPFYSRVTYFSMDRLKEELRYIARKVKQACPQMGMLRIADANYGMYERDVTISSCIGELQKEFGYPTFIDATTGKNRPERIIESVEKVGGALVVYQAVQSLNDEVLQNIRRSNIHLDAYEKVMIHVRGRGLRSNSDLIVGLPGETLESHIDAIYKLIDSGTNQMHNWQLILLKGSELERSDTRSKFSFATRWRLGPKNFGVYEGEKVFDVEEIVVATHTLSFEDYLQARKHHLVSSVFWNDSWFESVVAFAEKFGVKRSEWFHSMLPAMECGPESVRGFLGQFVRDTVSELFPSRESCIEFYNNEENFQRLLDGEIGDNLMYRYRALASFWVWKDICRTAMHATRELLLQKGANAIPGFDRFWDSFEHFQREQHAHGRTPDEVLAATEIQLEYDIPRWMIDGMPKDASEYRLDEPTVFRFELTEEGARELTAGFRVWTPTLRGLTKMVTRIRMPWQVRKCVLLQKGTAECRPLISTK